MWSAAFKESCARYPRAGGFCYRASKFWSITCPKGKCSFLRFCNRYPAHQKIFFGVVKITLGLLNASYSLSKWQAVKLTFFAPWVWSAGTSTFLRFTNAI